MFLTSRQYRWDVGVAALKAAAADLARRHPAFRPVIEEAGPPDLRQGRPRQAHFAELARAICYQQLAGPAARTIHGRFVALFDGKPTPGGRARGTG